MILLISYGKDEIVNSLLYSEELDNFESYVDVGFNAHSFKQKEKESQLNISPSHKKGLDDDYDALVYDYD